jgi:hypothetical protein
VPHLRRSRVVRPDFPGLTAGATHCRPYGPGPSDLQFISNANHALTSMAATVGSSSLCQSFTPSHGSYLDGPVGLPPLRLRKGVQFRNERPRCGTVGVSDTCCETPVLSINRNSRPRARRGRLFPYGGVRYESHRNRWHESKGFSEKARACVSWCGRKAEAPSRVRPGSL